MAWIVIIVKWSASYSGNKKVLIQFWMRTDKLCASLARGAMYIYFFRRSLINEVTSEVILPINILPSIVELKTIKPFWTISFMEWPSIMAMLLVIPSIPLITGKEIISFWLPISFRQNDLNGINRRSPNALKIKFPSPQFVYLLYFRINQQKGISTDIRQSREKPNLLKWWNELD